MIMRCDIVHMHSTGPTWQGKVGSKGVEPRHIGLRETGGSADVALCPWVSGSCTLQDEGVIADLEQIRAVQAVRCWTQLPQILQRKLVAPAISSRAVYGLQCRTPISTAVGTICLRCSQLPSPAGVVQPAWV